MNYNHIFHAGNFADVMKHMALILIMQKLSEKEAPYAVIDTHAGQGLYDLHSDKAQRTSESDDGVGRILNYLKRDVERTQHQEVFTTYFKIIQMANQGTHDLRFYPGSPKIIQNFLRAHDKVYLAEWHQDTYETLQILCNKDPRIKVSNTNGYDLLKTLLPVKEKRGLILIDPPYEVKDEWQRITLALTAAIRRFSHGIYMIWYPIKDEASVDIFLNDLRKIVIKQQIINCQLIVNSQKSSMGLKGSGLIVINPPWQFAEHMTQLLNQLQLLLTNDKNKATIVEYL